MDRIVHFDNASTTWPKPPQVLAAMQDWFERLGCDAARGGSPRHAEVAARVRALRARLAALTGVPAPHVILGSGATEMLNLAIKGLLDPGATVWCSGLEHNAVIRPLVRLRDAGQLQLRVFTSASGAADPAELARAAHEDPAPALLVLNHASNVTGELQEPIAALETLRARGTRVLLDCAQSIGRVDVRHVSADAYVVPGHKALMGPPGVGALCLREDLRLRPWKEGGTGEGREHMPQGLPHAYESGTPNTPGYFGLLAGIEWTLERGSGALLAHERRLVAELRAALAPLERAGRLTSSGGHPDGLAIVSLSSPVLDSWELAALLEDQGFFTRAGLQCAPWAHDALPDRGAGSLRVSPGPFNTSEEVRALAAAIEDALGD